MVQVKVRTTTNSSTVLAEINETAAAVLAKAEVETAGKSIQLNGMTLSVKDINTKLNELGVEDGTTVMLGCVQKADSAR